MMNVMSLIRKVILIAGFIAGSIISYGQPCTYSGDVTINDLGTCPSIEISNGTLSIDMNGAVNSTLNNIVLKEDGNVNFVSGKFTQSDIRINDDSNLDNIISFSQSGAFASDILAFNKISLDEETGNTGTTVNCNGVVSGDLDFKFNHNGGGPESAYFNVALAELYGNLNLNSSTNIDINILSVYGSVNLLEINTDIVDSLYIEDDLIIKGTTMNFKNGSRVKIGGDLNGTGGSAKIIGSTGSVVRVEGDIITGSNISFDISGYVDIGDLWQAGGEISIKEGAEVETGKFSHSGSNFNLESGTFEIIESYTVGNLDHLTGGTFIADVVTIADASNWKGTKVYSNELTADDNLLFQSLEKVDDSGSGCIGFQVCTVTGNIEVFCVDNNSGQNICYDTGGGCTEDASQSNSDEIAYSCPSGVSFKYIKSNRSYVNTGNISSYTLAKESVRDNRCVNMFSKPYNGKYLSDKVCSSISVLPVELSHFSVAKYGESSARLAWVTASEKNNDYFIVYRSYDAQNYSAVGTVAGAGNSSSAVMYDFVDDAVDADGYVYYKLVQVDYDGTRSASKVKSLRTFNNTLAVYPTKLQSGESVTIEGIPSETPFVVAITDEAAGRVQYRRFTADGSAFEIPVSQATGAYVLSLILPDAVYSYKLIIE